jgi:hypothetical protein
MFRPLDLGGAPPPPPLVTVIESGGALEVGLMGSEDTCLRDFLFGTGGGTVSGETAWRREEEGMELHNQVKGCTLSNT